MTTEPTQTPRTDAIWKTRTLSDRTDDNAYLESVSLERDLAQATQRIAELESRVKQLEGAVRGADEAFAKLFWTTDDGINTRDGVPEDCDADAFTLARWKACRAALSPSPPAVAQPEERLVITVKVKQCPVCMRSVDYCKCAHPDDAPVEVERWAKEKAHFAKGGRVQLAFWPNGPWHNTPQGWQPPFHKDGMAFYRIAPDDAPPVQTEEKPATVPLAVAEGSPFVRWVREDRLKCWELIVANPRRSAATVWDNGTWHTWDRDGVGGENSSEETVDRAKVEASASAIVQGFI